MILELLKNGKIIEFGDLRAQYARQRVVSLPHANLRKLDLKSVIFYDADLSDADLSGANLSGAYIGDADLSGTHITDAQLKDAIDALF